MAAGFSRFCIVRYLIALKALFLKKFPCKTVDFIFCILIWKSRTCISAAAVFLPETVPKRSSLFNVDLCDIDDIRWLEDFYSRIMNQTDPLALYAQSISSQSSKSVKSAHNHESIHKSVNNNTYDTQHGKDYRLSSKHKQNLFLLACCTIIVVAVIFLTCKYR